ncbi:TRAP transporter small permease [Ramlibacter alkalitolerans]|jgi:TRAP-type C4-dicarboxylate transport system permease small subunit|uniref:TRAP transporter small permease protein n=1 Tax=Ramlibacter alkalitolerans TaxID=2039631 RepID=A0ABS1JWL7_9BURK|nr:TRAP transporter small permease [Ramlibacter alkalitolerans]MBL0428526.1 TRAP transporter small permease [Ramlibacter alkalitolerans]
MPHTEAAAPATATQRFRRHYGLLLEWVVMALMVALAVEVTLGVVFRAIGQSLVWYDEVASIMLAWLTFYGSALASVKRAHIGCPEVVDQLPSAWKRWLGLLTQLLVIAFFALLGWVGLQIMPILAGDTLVSLPWVPMNFAQSVIPISAALIVVAEATHLIDLWLARPQAVSGAALADGLH